MKSSIRPTDTVTQAVLKVASPGFAALVKFAEGEITNIGPDAPALSRSIGRTVARGKRMAFDLIEDLDDKSAIKISPAVEEALLNAAYGSTKDTSAKDYLVEWLDSRRPAAAVNTIALELPVETQADAAPRVAPELKAPAFNLGVTAQRSIRKAENAAFGLAQDVRREYTHIGYELSRAASNWNALIGDGGRSIQFRTRDVLADLSKRVRSVVTSDTLRKASLAACSKFILGAEIIATDMKALLTPSKVAMALVVGGALAGGVMALHGGGQAYAGEARITFRAIDVTNPGQFLTAENTADGFPAEFASEFPDSFPNTFPGDAGVPDHSGQADQSLADEMAEWHPEYDASLDQEPLVLSGDGLKKPGEWDYPINITHTQLAFFGAEQEQIALPSQEFLDLALLAFTDRFGDVDKAQRHLNNVLNTFDTCFDYEDKCRVESLGLSLDARHGVYALNVRGVDELDYMPRTVATEFAGDLQIVDQEALAYLHSSASGVHKPN